MSDTKRKTLKLRQRDVSGEFVHNEKSVELHGSNEGGPLDRHNVDMVDEQRRRIDHPHDEGS